MRLFIRRPKATNDSLHITAQIYVNLSVFPFALSHNRLFWIVPNTVSYKSPARCTTPPCSMKLEINRHYSWDHFRQQNLQCDTSVLQTPGLDSNGFMNALSSFYVTLDTSPFLCRKCGLLCPPVCACLEANGIIRKVSSNYPAFVWAGVFCYLLPEVLLMHISCWV